MDFALILERGRYDFSSATRNLSPQDAASKPNPGAWSSLECIEHVVLVEMRYLDWITNGHSITPEPNPKNELRIFTMIRSRLTPINAPEKFWPAGRFTSLATALSEFQSIRDRTIATANELGDNLYSIGAAHPFFGKVNGAEIIQLIDGHARRHADQIRDNTREP